MSEYQKAGKPLKLFVSGRLCLFGEHNDWAGMHRMVNTDVGIRRCLRNWKAIISI